MKVCALFCNSRSTRQRHGDEAYRFLTVTAQCAGPCVSFVTPQKLGRMPSQLVPKRGYELPAAAGIQVSCAYRQPQTEGEGHAEVQQSGGREAEQGPDYIVPGEWT
jgi:hypothetical protein